MRYINLRLTYLLADLSSTTGFHCFDFFLLRDAMHKRGLCCHAVSVRVGYTHHSSFSIPNGVAIFRREPPPPNGGVECRWGRQKMRFWTNIWLRCYRSTVCSTVQIATCEKQSRDDRRVEHTVASVVYCSHKTTTKCS